VLDTIKKAEDRDSTIIRLHEMEGSSEQVIVQSAYAIKRWREVNLMEEEADHAFHDTPIKLDFTPYEIKTIEIEMDR
jgi:alpha-mannosidase